MKTHWVCKTHPEHQPVRFLAQLWQDRMKSQFGVTIPSIQPRQFGQLKSLRKELEPFTRHVVEWMLDPVHWGRFCQQVRLEANMVQVPDRPHIGFLLKQRYRALRIMRSELRNSTAPADVEFCTKLDRLRYEQMKTLVVVYADGNPDRLAKIDAAKTLIDIYRVFIEMVDQNTASG